MQTLIDPFELSAGYVPPPARAPMATISVDVEFEEGEAEAMRPSYASDPENARDSWGRVRCWCSED